jgi:ABC-type nitrate/sulfonate/bicarbonate transport system substrate-binding protein
MGVAARAQHPALPVVGILDAASTGERTLMVGAFRQGLAEAGFVEGRDVAIEFRWADGQYHLNWTLQVANIPAAITCTDVMAEKHPELAVAFMRGMIKVGRWSNEHKQAAAAILDRQTFYLDVEDTYRGIKSLRQTKRGLYQDPGPLERE